MANDDAALVVSVSAQITSLQKQLDKAGLLGEDFAKKLEARLSNLKLAPNDSALNKLNTTLNSTSKASGNTSQALQTLQAAAHRTFDSIAAGQSPLRALEQQAGDLVSAVAEGGGLMSTLTAVGSRLAGLASPAGLAAGAVGLLAAGVYLYANRQTEAAKAAADFDDWLKKIGADSPDTAANIDKVTAAIKGVSYAQAGGLQAGAAQQLTDLSRQAGQVPLDGMDLSDILLKERVANSRGSTRFDPGTVQAAKDIQALIDKTKNGQLGIDEMHQALDDLAKTSPSLAKTAAALQPVLDKIVTITGASQTLGNALHGMGAYQPRPNNVLPPSAQAGIAAADAGNAIQDLNLTAFDKAVQDRMTRIRDELLSQQIVRPEDEIRQRAVAEVTQEGINQGGGDIVPVLKAFIDHVERAESNGNPTATNPNSTATGVGQFVESTWLDLFRKYYPVQAQSMGEDAILALRNDAEISRQLIEAYAKENAAALQKSGLAVTEANLQLAHFLGPGGAVAVLKAAPSTPVSQILSRQAVAANPKVLGNGATASDVIAYANRRANDTRVAAGDLTQAERQVKSYDDLVKKGDEYVANLQTQRSAMRTMNEAEIEAAHYQQLLNEAKQQGIVLSPQQQQGLQAEAEKMAQADVAARNLTESQRQLNERLDFLGDQGVEFFKGLIAGGDQFKESLQNIASALEDAILQATLLGKGPLAGLFGAAAPSGGGLGGLFGGLLSMFGGSGGGGGGATLGTGLLYAKGGYLGGFANGGGLIRGPGTGTSDSVPATDGKGRFARFSNGEFIVNAEGTRQYRGVLEAINSGRLKGYADGGMIGAAMSTPAPNLGMAAPGIAGRTGDAFGSRPVQLSVTVSGARGNQEIRDMARQGTLEVLAQYDRRRRYEQANDWRRQ